MTSWRAISDAAHEFFDAAAAAPDRVLVAMDFDGTLAPIVDDPDLSALHPAAATALTELGHRVGHLVVITGRPVETVVRLGRLAERPGLDRLVVLGQYGAERWDAATGVATPPETPQSVAVATVELERLLDEVGPPGVHLEHKGRAVGVHTRRCPDPVAAFAELKPHVARIAAANGLVLEPGKFILELRASTVTKGEALRDIVEETGALVVAMCGDDLGDLPAFELLDDLAAAGLATCRVVSGSAELPALGDRADVLADGPAGVAAWLSEVASRVGA